MHARRNVAPFAVPRGTDRRRRQEAAAAANEAERERMIDEAAAIVREIATAHVSDPGALAAQAKLLLHFLDYGIGADGIDVALARNLTAGLERRAAARSDQRPQAAAE